MLILISKYKEVLVWGTLGGVLALIVAAILLGCKTVEPSGYIQPDSFASVTPERIDYVEDQLGDYLWRCSNDATKGEELLCFLAVGAVTVREYNRDATSRPSIEDRLTDAVNKANWYSSTNFKELLKGKAYQTYLLDRLGNPTIHGPELWLGMIKFFTDHSDVLIPLLQEAQVFFNLVPPPDQTIPVLPLSTRAPDN